MKLNPSEDPAEWPGDDHTGTVTASMKVERRTRSARVTLGGRRYVILPREDYDRLTRLARAAGLPALPAADAEGSFPAVAYVRASIARSIVRERVRLGLTQRDVARRAGIRVETLCRIETGKHTASTATLAKVNRALRGLDKGRRATRKGP